MLTMNYTYRIYPDASQQIELLEWLETCRRVSFAKVNPNGTSQTCPKCLVTVRKELGIREHHCRECGYRTHRDHAAAEVVLHRGLENVVAQGHWGRETACQVGLSGVSDLDKWRGAGMPNREVGGRVSLGRMSRSYSLNKPLGWQV
ncbi:zinc ribbon domain-containing protein [Thermosynechococcaceae cyanobacterium Okahandja]